MKKLLFVLLLSGCAAPMTKSGVTDAEVARDRDECIYQADMATAGLYDAIARGIRRNELVVSCMRLRGYQ